MEDGEGREVDADWGIARAALYKGRGPRVDNSFGNLERVVGISVRDGRLSKGLGCNSGDHVGSVVERARFHRCSARVDLR